MARVIVTATAVCTVASCDLGTTVIPRTDPALVVHAILEPGASEQVVLVQESLSGSGGVTGEGSTHSGIPVPGAVVKLTDPEGFVFTASEVFLVDGQRSTGSYVFAFPPLNLRRGKRYTLVVSAEGKTVTGSTVIPDAPLTPLVSLQSFNRDHDSVALAVPQSAVAHAFWLRIESPLAAYSLFTVGRRLSVSGLARNFEADNLVHVFYPGFIETVTFAAVDTNVYDYYRSGNDPFSGTGLINHLSGGLGVFGSVVTLETRVLDVTQDPTGDPIEGRFTLRSNPSTKTLTSEMTLYLEAPGNGHPDQISGLYLRSIGQGNFRAGVLGTRDGTLIQLDLLTRSDPAAERAFTFYGTQRGDTLIGGYSKGATDIVLVRAGK